MTQMFYIIYIIQLRYLACCCSWKEFLAEKILLCMMECLVFYSLKDRGFLDSYEVSLYLLGTEKKKKVYI